MKTVLLKDVPKNFLSIASIVFVITLLLWPRASNTTEKGNAAALGVVGANTEQTIENPFDSISIKAAAAYILDVSTNSVLYEKNSEAQLPLASLTKIMTVLVAASALQDDEIITIQPDDLRPEGDSGLRVGEKWDFNQLAEFTLISSSNDGANALARALEEKTGRSFQNLSAELAKELGLRQTYFINPTGLDQSGTISGGYGSARDVAMLLAAATKKAPTIFKSTSSSVGVFSTIDGVKHVVKNTNEEVRSSVGIIASKTGTTDLAGGNLAVMFDVGPVRPVVAVILGSGADERFNDMQKLSEATFEYIGSYIK